MSPAAVEDRAAICKRFAAEALLWW